MLSRRVTTTAVTSTSLGHASVTACTRAGSASWMRLITAKHRGTNADNIQGDERRPETHGVASVALVGMRVSFLDASAAHRNDSEKKKRPCRETPVVPLIFVERAYSRTTRPRPNRRPEVASERRHVSSEGHAALFRADRG